MAKKGGGGEETKAVGRPRSEIDPDMIRQLSLIGCTYDEIADVLQVSLRTLMRHMEEDAKIVDENGDPCGPLHMAREAGLAGAAISIRRLMWRHARGSGGSAVAATKHLAAFILGEHERALVEVIPGGAPTSRPVTILLSERDMNL